MRWLLQGNERGCPGNGLACRPAGLEKAGCHWGCGQLPERLIHHGLAVSHVGSRSAVQWHAVSARGFGGEWERG